MKSRTRTTPLLATLAGVFLIFSAKATVTITSDTFEGMAADSISKTTAPENETKSAWQDVTNSYKPVTHGGVVSTAGNARTDVAGFGGTYGAATNAGISMRVRSSTGAATLDSDMQLVTLGASSVTISFDLKEGTADGTYPLNTSFWLALYYSALGDMSDAVLIDTFLGNGTHGVLGTWNAYSKTITNGAGGIVFTNTAQMMIGRLVRGSGSNPTFHSFDNIVITAETGSDITPPTLLGSDIADDRSGGPVGVNTLVTYMVTFNEDMDAGTIEATDFGNAGTAAISIGTVTEGTPGVFSVPVTPTSAGTLRLKVNAAAVLKDVAGNVLVTTPAIEDNTTITVNASNPYTAWAGGASFDDDANGDDLDNGMAWMLGAASPSANGLAVLPAPGMDPGFLTLQFKRVNNQGPAKLYLDYGNNLTDWIPVEIPAASGTVGGDIVVQVTAGSPNDDVTVKIPTTHASPSGRILARLRATP